MRRLLLVACVAIALACLGSIASARPLPTLGLSSGGPAEGFGEIEPSIVSLGGDPTGVVTNVSWRTWGGKRAIGHGKGWFLPPSAPDVAHGHPAGARLVAWDRGYCRGQWAYRKVEWYFPGYNRGGHSPPGTYFDPKYATRTCDAP
jgi:hypothetical protein